MSRVGYLIIIALSIALFLPDNVEAQQQNCTTFTAPILLNYSIELRNLSNNDVTVDYAFCNLTIPGSTINDSVMINEGAGIYSCPIQVDFPTNKYGTQIVCKGSNTTANMRGNFEVVPDDVPLTIIGFFVGLSVFFLFYSIKLENAFAALKNFMFLLTLLMYYIIFALTVGLIGEEGASPTLTSLSETIFIVYTYLFYFLVFYVIIVWIMQVLSFFSTKKKEKAQKGVIFD